MKRILGEHVRLNIREGLAAAWPICLGFFPIGLSLGVLGQKVGLAPWQMALMSLVVFAGGSQFIAVAMLGSGASLAAIVTTTFMVNLRHLLMSSALAVHFPGVSRRFLALFAYGVTDESFAVNMARFNQGGWNRHSALVLNQVTNATWFFSTVAGAFAGQFGVWVCEVNNDIQGAVVTEIKQYPRRRALEVIAAGGSDMPIWIKSLVAALDRHARATGCACITSLGRPGWLRAWGAEATGDIAMLRRVEL